MIDDFSFFNVINYFWAVLGLRCCVGFSLLGQAGATLYCGARATHCSVFSGCRAQALESMGSVAVAQRLSCPEACWNVPGPGIEPGSPALAGRFLTTGPQGKSESWTFYSSSTYSFSL